MTDFDSIREGVLSVNVAKARVSRQAQGGFQVDVNGKIG
jgi:hypothetical protein